MLCNRRLLVRQLWSLGHLSIREGRLEESIQPPHENKRHVASGRGVWLHSGRIFACCLLPTGPEDGLLPVAGFDIPL
jgi:hypothetical protein